MTTSYDSSGLNYSLKGAMPTRDGKFKGRKYTCAICGRTGRKPDMAWQNGKLVHRDTCKDTDGGRIRRV